MGYHESSGYGKGQHLFQHQIEGSKGEAMVITVIKLTRPTHIDVGKWVTTKNNMCRYMGLS